jgi:hypothetical protein
MPNDENLAAREWLQKFIEDNQIDYDALSPSQRFLLMREIPCNIRCWRVGGAVTTVGGEPCPECGSPVPKPTAWDKIPLPV